MEVMCSLVLGEGSVGGESVERVHECLLVLEDARLQGRESAEAVWHGVQVGEWSPFFFPMAHEWLLAWLLLMMIFVEGGNDL